MISHKYKCIFIHISKCAGSSVESAFGIDVDKVELDLYNLHGWHPNYGLYLQHATPQQLLDFGFISEEIWNSYYKFIIVRNPWDRAFSDYLWIVRGRTLMGSFKNYLKKKGCFKSILDDNYSKGFRGDHLYKQIDYFYLNGNEINYNNIIRFENIENGFEKVIQELNLPSEFFNITKNVNYRKRKHYSVFYNKKRKAIFDQIYLGDAIYLNYGFEDRKKTIDRIYSELPSVFFLSKSHWKKYIKNKIRRVKIEIFRLKEKKECVF